MDRRLFLKNALAAGGIIVAAPSLITSCRNARAPKDSRKDDATGMTYRRLGKTGLMVSEIGLGAEWLERLDAEGCKHIVDLAEEAGINIIDVWMPGPDIRTKLGDALKGRRERWFIQGHIGSTWKDGQYFRTRDMSLVEPAFEDLLTRLQTDYIDLGMIHYVDDIDEWKAIEGGNDFYKYVMKLKRQGKIRHIGLSTHNPEVALAAAQSGIIEMMLFSCNPVYDSLPAGAAVDFFAPDMTLSEGSISQDRAALYSYCESHDIGITVMKGYAGGRLLKAETSPFGVALTPVQCIHYALTRPAVASILVGFGEPDHVAQAVAYETATDEEKDYASVLAAAPMHAFSGACTYCGHCKPCKAGIDIAMVNKLTDLATMQPEVPASVKDHYKVLKLHGSDCLEDGECMTRCPFGVDIIANMRAAADIFGY